MCWLIMVQYDHLKKMKSKLYKNDLLTFCLAKKLLDFIRPINIDVLSNIITKIIFLIMFG